MRTEPVPPYLLPSAEVVEAGPWEFTADGRPLPQRLEHWDPQTVIRVSRSLRVDRARLREEAHLADSVSLAFTSSWYADRTRLRGSSRRVPLDASDGNLAVDLVIPGTDAGGRLELRTTLTLVTGGIAASPLAASRCGAILWRDEVVVLLEGDAARFPVTALDFGAGGTLPPRGGWTLDWQPDDLDAPLTGALRLLVNSGRGDVREAITTAGGGGAAAAWRSFILLDVARQLVHAALRNERFLAHPDGWPPGSLGRMLAELIERCWPDRSPTALAARLEREPERLEVELQAALEAVGR